jgi:carboxyl-terminal processing protease
VRIGSDPLFQSYIEDVNESKEVRERNLISLNESVRKKEKEEQDLKREQIKSRTQNSAKIKLVVKGELPQTESTSDDALLNESAYILSDLIYLTTG